MAIARDLLKTQTKSHPGNRQSARHKPEIRSQPRQSTVLRTLQVYIDRDEVTGDVILSRRPKSWAGLLAAIKDGGVPDDFLDAEDRSQHEKDRDPCTGITL